MRRLLSFISFWCLALTFSWGQINTDRVLTIGRNALYYEDYVLSIQYFNEVIGVKPYLAEPYLYRSIAKIYLDDYVGANQDATLCIDRNPFLVTAYQVRGIARENMQDYDGAIADFEEGLKIQPENKVFLRQVAVCHALKKDYDKADSCFAHFIGLFPSESSAYLNRAQLLIERGDSVKALADLNRVIELDKSSAYAFAMRAMVFEGNDKHSEALADMDMAIRLDPEQSGFYINRGLIRYNVNDFRGALEDYDQAIEIEPQSVISLYNRGLLRAQLGERNKAIDDFTSVLKYEPENTFASYNRAILRDETGDLAGAVEDYTDVFSQHPNFFPALYARAEDNKKLGRSKAADEDFKQAFTVEQRVRKERDERARRRKQMIASGVQNVDSILMAEQQNADDMDLDDASRTRRESDRNIRKFNRIMSAGADTRASRYESAIRGKVQDQQFVVELQPLFVLSYYEKTDDIRQGIYFEKTLSDFNRSGLLSRRLKVVCHEPMLSQAQVQAHFASIDDNSRLIGISGGNLITFFGRSLDFMLTQDYQSAIEDLNQVILRKDNFILAYFNRAVMRFRLLEISERSGEMNAQVHKSAAGDDELKNSALTQIGTNVRINNNSAFTAQDQLKIRAEQMEKRRRMEFELAMHDLDKVIQLSPTFVYAYYNRAYMASKLNNFDAALEDLNKAIELYPNFAEAYYNRALVYLRTGKTKAGLRDLSKAGELGLSAAYGVLKRANSE